jgi:hypothetical protein
MEPHQLNLFPRPRLVGLYSSAMQSGKSTVADFLCEYHGFRRVKFAGPLKDMTRVLLASMNLDTYEIEQRVEGPLKEAPIPGFEYTSARHIMQTLGTEWRDQVDTKLWTRIAMSQVDHHMRLGRSVVIDDMRFPHEFEAILAVNGVTTRVYRPSATVTSKHSSEGLLDGYTFQFGINNNSTLHDLRDAVANFVKEIR